MPVSPDAAVAATRRALLVPDIAWVEIPGGDFRYQGERRSIRAFRIARYPVTNLQ